MIKMKEERRKLNLFSRLKSRVRTSIRERLKRT